MIGNLAKIVKAFQEGAILCHYEQRNEHREKRRYLIYY